MPPKRKRISEAGNRPSPHRPSDAGLGQHERDYQDSAHHRRGQGGGRNTRRNNNDRRDSSGPVVAPASNHRVPASPVVGRPSSSSSHTAPVPVQPAPPVMTQPPVQPPRIPISTNYNYVILTEIRLSAWQQGGRQEVIEHGITSRSDEDIEEISTICQEFTRAVLENCLSPTDAGNCMRQILGSVTQNDSGANFAFDAQTLFLDTISVFLDSNDAATTSQFRELIAATEIPSQLVREVLDAPALQQLGLIRDNFAKLGIKYATNQLYRQANYNLLREESEGYSKLAAELYRTPYQSQGHHDFALVQASWERIKSLIGTFDLDVGRVLDVVIDVFSATMLRNLIFFTRLLRISSWWPRNQIEHAERLFAGGLPKWALREIEGSDADDMRSELEERTLDRDIAFWNRAREIHLDAFFELGGRRIEDAELLRLQDGISKSDPSYGSNYEWIKNTKTLPPCGNRVAAQLLGFKFRFYTSDARDKGETLPANLYYLAAFLIKIGFVSLADLYSHLWPADEDMDALRRRREDELAEKERNARQGNTSNALLMAGALTDDTLLNTSKVRESGTAKVDGKAQEAAAQIQEDENNLPEPKEAQKADLVSHLLVVGAVPEALFIIGRFPWLPEAYPDEIYPAINRILLHSINKVYESSRPIGGFSVVAPTTVKQDLALDQAGMPKGNLRLVDGVPAKVLRWPHADGTSKGILYRFYLDEWSDNIPICQTVDDVFTLCHTLLNISGVNIGRDPVLVKKIASIGVKSLKQDSSPHNFSRWQDLLRRTLVPSLCLTNANVDAVVAVWDLLKNYPTQIRYTIYAECYEGSISRLEAMKQAFKAARSDTLATLKRLSLENIPMSAKKLAKIALSSPGVVCKVALDQIEAYTNLIEAFVECTKYFTELGYDVLVWSLLSSLGGKQRSRTSETSVLLTSRWLQALSRFSGKVFRRYENVDSTPVIQYVNEQVAHGNSTDLVILRELITSMAGIVPDVDFTDGQLSALSGGDLLRRQTLTGLGDKRYESEKSASRLMKALLQANMASQLLINMAQYRQSAIYQVPEDEAHIKYLATVVDDSQHALVQYMDLLRDNLSAEEFDARVPSIPWLMTNLGLDANLAFLIGRASLTYYLTGAGDKVPVKRTADNEGDIIMDPTAASTGHAATDDSPEQMAVDGAEVTEESLQQPPSVVQSQSSDRFLDVLNPIIEAVKPLLPQNTWNKISPEFFVLFWALQTGDLDVPIDSYKAEFLKLDKERDELKRDRSDMSRTGASRKEAKMAAIEHLSKELPEEASRCKERVTKTKLLLIKQSPIWFNPSAKVDSVVDTFIEECLLPRTLLSPGDADFCHRIIRFLHFNRVANFKLSNLYNRLFNVNRLRSMIFGCTVREAEFLGRFIKLTLAELSVWHANKETFEKEAIGHGRLGFATSLDASKKPVTFMAHDEFRDLLWTWHRNLFAALKSCLGDIEWMHIRNAITILKAGLEYFPSVDFMGRQLNTSLAKIAEREAATKSDNDDGQGHRVDLAVTANTAISALKKRSSKWVMVQEFRPNTSGDAIEEKKSMEMNKASQYSTLRANAHEFRPQPQVTSTRTKPGVEEEDGEVEDGNISLANSQMAGTTDDTLLTRPSSSHRKGPPLVPQKIDSRPIPSRSSTPGIPPTSSITVPSGRTDSGRPHGLVSMPGGMHGLPSRPEVPFPAHFTHDQFGTIKTLHPRDHREVKEHRDGRDRGDSREARDPREVGPRENRELRDPRTLRTPEDPRPTRPRDYQAPDRRVPEPAPREAHRPERDRLPHRLDSTRRIESGPQDRDIHQSRDRAPSVVSVGRGGDTGRDTPAATKPMPPPSQPEPVGPTVNPERARFINADRSDDRSSSVNPQRVVRLNDSRSSREDSRDRNPSRIPSPRRGDRSESRGGDPLRDERRTHHGEHHIGGRDQRNESQPVPVRSGRIVVDHESDRSTTDRTREPPVFPGQGASARGENEHGRLALQDPEYGRLSSIPSIGDMGNPPEGPRGRGRHATRGPMNIPQVRPEHRHPGSDNHRPASPERQHPPTGPSSSRQRRNQNGMQHGPTSGSTTGPSTVLPGMHPERLRQLNSTMGGPSQPPFTPPIPAPASVHPDRMAQIVPQSSPTGGPPHQAGRPLPPLQTPERLPPINTANHRPSPTSLPNPPVADNSPISAPTGPAAANDRSRGSRRQLSGINSILQGGPNVRPKGSRTNLAGSDAQVLTGASPVSTPVTERPEPFPPKERSSRNDHERGRREHDGSDRSSRTQRRGSRERTPERDHRSKEHREYRERKSGAGSGGIREGEKDLVRRSGREQNLSRETLPSRSDMLGNGRDGPRELRHRGDGGNSRHEDMGRAGSGRGGGPRTEDRRELRSSGEDHRNRKRRSEEFGGPAEKRPRR